MSLEDTIKENTAAVVALTAALKANAEDQSPFKPATNNQAYVDTDKMVIVDAVATAAGLAVTAAGQPELAPVAEVTAKVVLEAAGKLIAKVDKLALGTALKGAGIDSPSIKNIPPEKLQAALDAITAAIAAAEAKAVADAAAKAAA